jgi:Tol biopolymer transport system component
MKWIAPLLVLSTVAVSTQAPSPRTAPPSGTSAPQRPAKQYTMEQFLNTTAIQGGFFSPDESRLLFSSNKTGIWNAYTVPVAGGEWTPLTKSTKDSTYAIAYFPHDARVLITRDQGGNEINHLYVLGEDGAEKDLTPGVKEKAQFLGFSYDGNSFFVATNGRDPKFFDLYRYDARTYARTTFYENQDGYFLSDVSDDGQWLALGKPNTTNDSDIYVWNVATKQANHISKHSGDANYQPMQFDHASKYLYFLTDAGGEFTSLKRYALADGKVEDVQSAPWDIQQMSFSRNDKYRATIVNHDGRPVVSVIDTARTLRCSCRPCRMPAWRTCASRAASRSYRCRSAAIDRRTISTRSIWRRRN